ncbi:MAG: substrate-binding domain-containing protein [Verrucomicrobia bacterium]|nr:substrate-binding domain-containing protein [Verrucomicrobiota bacterium]
MRIIAQSTLAAAAVLLAAPLPPVRAADDASPDTINALKAQADHFRIVRERGEKAYYQPRFDLSALPHYQPEKLLTGWLKIHGNNYIADGLLGEYWAKAFAKFQPGIRISYYLPTSAGSFGALDYNQADLIFSHRPGFYDLLAYERMKNCDPVEIAAVTGSFDVGGWENSFTIIVNDQNPLKGLTMEQLDGIFGAEREGGWVGTNWRPDLARGPEKNIRTWGQLGLTGEWADQPIHVYGFAIRYNTATAFCDLVLKGSDKWNETIKAYGNYMAPDGKRHIEADQITDAIGRDKYAIGFNRYRGERPHIKRLAIGAGGGPLVEHTIDNVQNGSYPLRTQVYFYTTVLPGQKMDPMVREFLRFIVSQEGQAEVQRDGKYLPLTAKMAKEQLEKLP